MLEDKHVTINNLKVNFIHGGAGPATLLLPGWPGNFCTDDSLLIKLSANFEVYALNLPGFGCSEALPNKPSLPSLTEYLDEFVRYNKLTKVNLIGASYGGMLALNYAAKYPEKVSAAIVVAPLVRFSALPAKMRHIYNFIFGIRFLVPITIAIIEFILRHEFLFEKFYYLLTGYHYDGEESKRDYLKNRDNLRRMDIAKCFEMFQFLKELNITEECRKIEAKTLVLIGTQDGFIGDSPEQLANIMPDTKVEKLAAQHGGILKAYTDDKLMEFLGRS